MRLLHTACGKPAFRGAAGEAGAQRLGAAPWGRADSAPLPAALLHAQTVRRAGSDDEAGSEPRRGLRAAPHGERGGESLL